jgi:hypothetical protein
VPILFEKEQLYRRRGASRRADPQAGRVPAGRPLTEIVAIQSKSLTVVDPAFQAVTGDVTRAVAPFRSIHNVRSPLLPANRDQISRDGRTALVEWEMGGTLKAAERQVDPLTSAVASVAKAHPGFYVGEAGAVSSAKAISKLYSQQLE